MRTARVTGPLGEPVDAAWGLLREGRLAVIEMAQAAGLHLVPPERRDPTRTTTFGVGQLLDLALASGAEEFLVGIGGSATNDGGLGMAQALGWRFLDAKGCEIPPPACGGDLHRVARPLCPSHHRTIAPSHRIGPWPHSLIRPPSAPPRRSHR
jgi:glycerate kinase